MGNLLKTLFPLVCLGALSTTVHALDGAGRIVCGTNDANEIWCATYNGLEHGKWEHVQGSLTQVIVRDRQLWGVNAQGEIYYAPDVSNPKWIRLQGRAKEITEGHGVLCHVNVKDEVWCADKGITTPQPEWRKAPDTARLKFVSVN